MASPEALNTTLATQSYLGSESCATKEDYRVCASIKSVDEKAHPHLARWHAHVTVLAAKHPHYDWRGCPVPDGKGGGAKAPAAAPKATAAAPKAAAPASSAPKGAVDEAAIKAIGDEIRVMKDKLKGEGVTGKKLNEHPEIVALVGKLSAAKEGAPAEAAPKAKPEPAPKKGKGDKAEAKSKAEPKAKAAKDDKAKEVDPVEERKKKMKKVIKEGGKRGVEIEGAADMGGLQFFCTSVDEPEGDIEMLTESMKAMNAKSDPTEEERKGGSGHIGKMLFSAGVEHLAIAAYVPDEKQGECSCEEWLKSVLALFQGEVVSADKSVSTGKVKANGDKGIFPLKIREPMIVEANNFLRKKGLFPEDNSDDDDEIDRKSVV